jgi:hypothetical protein
MDVALSHIRLFSCIWNIAIREARTQAIRVNPCRGTSGTTGSALSCWGGNITDTRLYEKSGIQLYTCRTDNWNEKLGTVNAHGIALIVPQEATAPDNRLEPVTLADYLQNAGVYACRCRK